MIIGFGTGSLYKNVNPISKEAVRLVKTSECNAIELFIGFVERMDFLPNILRQDVQDFDYISLHAPDNFAYENNKKTKDLLEKLRQAHERLESKRIIIHPDCVRDFEVLDNSGLPFCFENHDNLKSSYRTVEDMEKLFLDNQKPMILDITHAYIVRGMRLTNFLYNRFQDRIEQFHLSGYKIHEDDGQQHYPISVTRQNEILTSFPLRKPIIIESVFPKYESIKELEQAMRIEIDYIKQFLDN